MYAQVIITMISDMFWALYFDGFQLHYATLGKGGGGGVMVQVEVQGRMARGMPKRRWLDRVRSNVKKKELRWQEVYNRATHCMGIR